MPAWRRHIRCPEPLPRLERCLGARISSFAPRSGMSPEAMRRSLAFTLGTAAIAAACTTPEPPPARVAQVTEEHMLIRPPDELAVVHILEAITYMPDSNDRLPARPANGASAEEWERSQALFKALIAQSSPQAQAELLAHESVDRDAPVDNWQQVRRFASKEKCETTKAELQRVTKLHSTRIGAKHGMLLQDLQFHLLAASFDLSQCVPVSSLSKVVEG
jgi:hypothetical protein